MLGLLFYVILFIIDWLFFIYVITLVKKFINICLWFLYLNFIYLHLYLFILDHLFFIIFFFLSKWSIFREFHLIYWLIIHIWIICFKCCILLWFFNNRNWTFFIITKIFGLILFLIVFSIFLLYNILTITRIILWKLHWFIFKFIIFDFIHYLIGINYCTFCFLSFMHIIWLHLNFYSFT